MLLLLALLSAIVVVVDAMKCSAGSFDESLPFRQAAQYTSSCCLRLSRTASINRTSDAGEESASQLTTRLLCLCLVCAYRHGMLTGSIPSLRNANCFVVCKTGDLTRRTAKAIRQVHSSSQSSPRTKEMACLLARLCPAGGCSSRML